MKVPSIALLSVTLALTSFSSSNAFGSVDELIDNYARTKLWEGCVGGDLAKEWEKRVDEVSLDCRQHRKKAPSSSHQVGRINQANQVNQIKQVRDRTFHRQAPRTQHLGLRNNQRHPRVFVTNSPNFGNNHWFNVPLTANRRSDLAHPNLNARVANGVQPVWFTLFDQIPIIVQPAPSHRNNKAKSRLRRNSETGRGAQFEIFLQNMVDSERNVRERLANFTCVLQSLDLVDNRGDLNFQIMEESTRNSALDVELRNDFLGVLDDCTRVSRCESYKSHVVPANLQRAFTFLRCARDRRQMACLKRDLRRYLRENLSNNAAKQVVDLEDMVDRIFYVTMAEMGHREVKNMLLV